MVSVTRIVCCFRVAESMRGEEDVEGGGGVVSEWLALRVSCAVSEWLRV